MKKSIYLLCICNIFIFLPNQKVGNKKIVDLSIENEHLKSIIIQQNTLLKKVEPILKGDSLKITLYYW